jgi:hypothetical protein
MRFEAAQTLDQSAAGFGLTLNKNNTAILNRADANVILSTTDEPLSRASLFGYFDLPGRRDIPAGLYKVQYEGEKILPGLDVSVPTSASLIDASGNRVAKTNVETTVLIAPDDDQHGGIEVGMDVRAADAAVPLKIIGISASKCYRVKNGWVIVRITIIFA